MCGTAKTNGETEQALRVFISHTLEDTPLAQHLATDLRRRGYKPWLDVESLTEGEERHTAMQKAISEADVAVVVVGTPSKQDPEVSSEWAAIRERSWEDPNLTLVGVLRSPGHVPAFLREWPVVRVQADDLVDLADKVVSASGADADAESWGYDKDAQSPEADVEEVVERFETLRQVMDEVRPSVAGRDG